MFRIHHHIFTEKVSKLVLGYADPCVNHIKVDPSLVSVAQTSTLRLGVLNGIAQEVGQNLPDPKFITGIAADWQANADRDSLPAA